MRNQYIYHKIYKENFGSLPIDENGRRYDIHHLDGNFENNDPKNLKAVTIQEHYDIHYAQGDWVACFMLAKRMKLSPKVISELASKSNLDRLKNGTHPSQKERTCPHCNVTGKSPGIYRWHFSNCIILTGKDPITDETRANMGASRLGKKRGPYRPAKNPRKPWSTESKAKFIPWNKGKRNHLKSANLVGSNLPVDDLSNTGTSSSINV